MAERRVAATVSWPDIIRDARCLCQPPSVLQTRSAWGGRQLVVMLCPETSASMRVSSLYLYASLLWELMAALWAGWQQLRWRWFIYQPDATKDLLLFPWSLWSTIRRRGHLNVRGLFLQMRQNNIYNFGWNVFFNVCHWIERHLQRESVTFHWVEEVKCQIIGFHLFFFFKTVFSLWKPESENLRGFLTLCRI